FLVRRRRPPRAQDGAPFPAPGHRRRPLRRRHRGHRGRVGAARGAEQPAGLSRRAGARRARDRTAGRTRVQRPAAGRAGDSPVAPVASITVTVFLTNVGRQPLTGLGIRLQRGEARTTRAELDAAVRDPDPATSVVPPFHSLSGTLAPGAQLPFTYTVTAADLH